MSSPSNLYAEKIFSEHPISLWSLDDESSYISLVDESDRQPENWTVSGGTFEIASDIVGEPFESSLVGRIIGAVPEGSSATVSLKSHDLFNIASINQTLSSISVGMYIYAENENIKSVEFGYEYIDPTSGENVEVLKLVKTPISLNWFYVSETFQVPNDSTQARALVKISYGIGTEQVPAIGDYNFLINGLSIGQWSEEFQSTSLGSVVVDLPTNIPISSTKGILAKSYGLQDNNGYYLVDNGAIFARNSGMPIVFGASNITSMYPNYNDDPSLILPGLGVLNNHGRFNDYCVELWIRINSNSVVEKRIFGPISSTDGLYVEGPFLTLKIGDNTASHFVGEWYRPMLININIVRDSASMLINGEQVLSLEYSTKDLDLPNEYVYDSDSEMYMHQDWLGFYAHQTISPIEIDCVAIYPYKVSNNIAKRRFIYGQGVEFPENTNVAYSGRSAFIDYQFAEYSNNYIYPDIGRWNQGIVDNLSTDGNTLSLPEYPTPTVKFDNKIETEWAESLSSTIVQAEDTTLISMKPGSGWSSTNGYLLFENLNFLKQDLKCVYGIFKRTSSSTDPETLFLLEDSQTGNYLKVQISGPDISYIMSNGGEEEVLYLASGNVIGDKFMAGIDIAKISSYFGKQVASFLGKRGSLRLYVAGYSNFLNTFSGNIYSIGLCSERNFSKISDLFNDLGFPVQYENVFDSFTSVTQIYDSGEGALATAATGGYFDNSGNFISVPNSFWSFYLDGGQPSQFATTVISDHIASYTLVPNIYMGKFNLDVAIDGYWEDYIPLTYLAKYVDDARGDKYYDLDFIQFNINYPAPSRFIEEVQYGSWTYDELQSEYANPTQSDYSKLDNHLISGFNDYADLKNRVVRTYRYDTSESFVRTYISFQKVSDGANLNYKSFSRTVEASRTGIVEPDSEWMNTKYEVVDNMIIYPPSGVDLNTLAIVTHIEVKVPAISKKPIKLKTLQYASQSFSYKSPNYVGTRFGSRIYPYKKNGAYFDYKSRNPFSIYKGSSPYLYMTKTSGIQLRGEMRSLESRGLSIPINSEIASSYKIATMQLAVRYDEEAFPASPMEIFEIESKNSYIKFYMESIHKFGKRAKIYAINANTGKRENGIFFYLNGKLVKEPVITIAEWSMLGIGFGSPIDFSNTPGAFRLVGPILMNSFSYYQFTNLQETQQTAIREWLLVKEKNSEDIVWNFWYPAFLWQGVLVISTTSFYGITPEDIYKTYTGTNKIIVDDDIPFRLTDYQYSSLNDVSWITKTVLPA